jgi:two-component system, NarL family, sensor kinase
MSDLPSTCDKLDATGVAWRRSATHLVVIILAIAGLPLIACVLVDKLLVIGWPVKWVGVVVYGGVLLALVLPRQHYRLRAWVVLGSLCVLAVAQLAINGLVGDGRIALLALPLLALVLLGIKEGWALATTSTIIMAIFTTLAGTGTLARWQVIKENSLDPGHWVIQGLLLLGALVPLMMLFTRFLALQRRTMMAESEARQQLENESARRRNLEGAILRLADEERTRLGAELHDGLGQDFLVISSQAQLSLCDATNPPGTNARLREIVETARQALEQTRRMAHNLRPGLLDELGLTKALRAMLQKVAQASAIPMLVEVNAVDDLLPPEAELNLFRITQEALNNVLKHSRATEVKVGITRETAGLKLVVEDNGCGFDPQGPEHTTSAQRGFGLHQIAVRASMIGGRLDVVSRHGHGTRLTVEVPIQGLRKPQDNTDTKDACEPTLPLQF